ncbi:MAG: hypothetical protein J1E62_12270 [Lachnospiraceae bacterium]|nr:hypothetical protein [Lachnospiraceae bacterium]
MERNIDVIKDADGNSIVMINDIRFKGKCSVNWDDVKQNINPIYYLADIFYMEFLKEVFSYVRKKSKCYRSLL